MSRFVLIARIAMMALVVGALIATLLDTSGLVDRSPFRLGAYYTLQSNVTTLAVWGALTWHAVKGTKPARWVEYGRAFVAANLVVVGIVYWSIIYPLGTEDGANLVVVMIIAHILTPIYATFDHLWVGTRTALPLRHLWVIVIYPTVWTIVAIIRAANGGWIPYWFLDPAEGWVTVIGVSAAVAIAMMVVGAVMLRLRRLRTIADPAGSWDDARPGRGETARRSAGGAREASSVDDAATAPASLDPVH